MQLLREGGLSIELDAVVLSTRTFSAAGELLDPLAAQWGKA